MFYYQSKKYDADNKDSRDMADHYVYYDSVDDDVTNMQGVCMNRHYMFFWNLGRAWKLSLKDKKITRLSIYISEQELNTKIKAIRATSDDSIVCIRVV